MIAYNLENLWRRLVLLKRIDNWSLTSSAAGEACPIQLATVGGKSTDTTAVRSHAAPDRVAAFTGRLGEPLTGGIERGCGGGGEKVSEESLKKGSV